jgi:hypothetical protein
MAAEQYKDLHGNFHRLDGPAAITVEGSQFWFIHGERHRTDGPASMYTNGDNYWWLDGIPYPFDIWLALTPLDEEQKLLLKLQYG